LIDCYIGSFCNGYNLILENSDGNTASVNQQNRLGLAWHSGRKTD